MTHYETLGVPPTATPDQIKKAFRKLSLEHHPDRPTGNAKKCQEINEAYEFLSDDRKRQQYDQSLNPNMNIFEMMFGGMGGPMGHPMQGHSMPGPMGHSVQFFQDGLPPGFMPLFKPPPLSISLEITLDQAYSGCSIPLPIERWVQVQNMKQLEKETYYVDIPAGIDSNECLIIPGKGNVGHDGKGGDVKVSISIKNTTKMERKGLDLFYKHTITLKEALCGFTFDLEYLHGKILKINNTTNIISPQYKKVIPSMGMKRDNTQGNLIICFLIVFPTTLPESTLILLRDVL